MSKVAIFKWKEVGEVMVTAFTSGTVSTETWDAYVRALKTKPIRKTIALGLGTVELSSVQRKYASDVVKERKIVSIVVTNDRFVRGLVTVGAWLGADVKAFPFDELDKAIKYLGLSPQLEGRVAEGIEEIQHAFEGEPFAAMGGRA
jgi:hypothetical protein